MVFSILAIFIVVGIVFCLFLSFVKAKKQSISYDSADADLQIYQMQLKEIDKDAASGLIDEGSAEEARLEIARSILKLNKNKKNKTTTQQSISSLFIFIVGICLIPVIAFVVYYRFGSPQLPEHPFYLLMEKDPPNITAQENMARLEVLALRNPSDAKTIEELAFYYLMANRYKDAANRFNNAITLDGETASRLTGLGMALVGDEGGVVNESAQNLFEKAIALDENQYFAQVYLAQVNMQNNRPDLALEKLQNLYNRLPENAPERQQLKQNIDALNGSMQDENTEQLLDKLYKKLQADPSKIEGWKLLIKTWADTGNKEKALAVLKDALSRVSSDNAQNLTIFAHEIGLSE